MRESVWRSLCLMLLTAALGSAQQIEKFREQIIAQERTGLDALKTGDLKPFADSTADNAIFVDAQGPAGKALVMQHTAEFRLHDYTMTDIQVVPVSPDAGLIVYKIAESGNSHGREFTAKAYVSSLWVLRDGKWVCLFSQETATR